MAKSSIGIKPIKERILVGIYDNGDTTIMVGGKKFYLLDDSSADKKRNIHVKHQGIRCRWAIVLSIPDSEHERGDISVGDKVLLDELKWSRGMNAPVHGDSRKIWSIPIEDVLLVGDDTNFSDADKVQLSNMYPNWESWPHEVL